MKTYEKDNLLARMTVRVSRYLKLVVALLAGALGCCAAAYNDRQVSATTEAPPTLAESSPRLLEERLTTASLLATQRVCGLKSRASKEEDAQYVWLTWPYANWPCGVLMTRSYPNLRDLMTALAPPLSDAISAVFILGEQDSNRVAAPCLRERDCLYQQELDPGAELHFYYDPSKLPKRQVPLVYISLQARGSGVVRYEAGMSVADVIPRSERVSGGPLATRSYGEYRGSEVLLFRVSLEEGRLGCFAGPYGEFPRYVMFLRTKLEAAMATALMPWDMVVVRDKARPGLFIVGEVSNPGVVRCCGPEEGRYWFIARPTTFASTVACWTSGNLSEANCGFPLGEGSGVVLAPNIAGLGERCETPAHPPDTSRRADK